MGWRETEGDDSLRRHVKGASERRRRSFQSQEKKKAAVFGAAPLADYDRQLTGFTKCWREQVGGPSDRRENRIIRSIISFSNSCFGVRLSSDGSREQKRERISALLLPYCTRCSLSLLHADVCNTCVCVSCKPDFDLSETSWGNKGKLN